MMLVKDIVQVFEKFAPLSLQESYDNSGLIIGDGNMPVNGVLITIDVTDAVLDEALSLNCNMIVSHHPLIFSGLKKLTGKGLIQRCVVKAIKNDIAIFSCHTNADSVKAGVSGRMADMLSLQNREILAPLKGELKKLVTFVPTVHADKVREAIFNVGAGHIGNYDSCSYNVLGKGTFRANDDANPFVGEKGELHYEEEVRVEVIFPKYIQSELIPALLKAHPYEEVAYDIYPLENTFNHVGMGIIGELEVEMDEMAFLLRLKQVFKTGGIRYTQLLNKKVKKVALCGGSGSGLLPDAIRLGADCFITGDFKYHQFFDADGKILIADIGHYESEQFTKEIFYELLMKNLPKFAVHFSSINTNPINYL